MSLNLALLRATRPPFLLLSPLCALLGVALAWQQRGGLVGREVGLVLLAALLAHAAVNLLNEHHDFRSGLDLLTSRTPFSGGSGALPGEPRAASRVWWAAVAALLGVVAIGGHFVWLRGWPLLAVGLLGLALVIGYTRWLTRFPWLCLLAPGLGFGPVMVAGTLLALGGTLDEGVALVSLVVMLLASELLLLNQVPDVDADRRAGRRHLPIVLGINAAGGLVAGLLAAAYTLLLWGLLVGWLPVGAWLTLLPLPAAVWMVRRLPHALGEPEALSVLMGSNVVILLATLVLLAAALWMG